MIRSPDERTPSLARLQLKIELFFERLIMRKLDSCELKHRWNSNRKMKYLYKNEVDLCLMSVISQYWESEEINNMIWALSPPPSLPPFLSLSLSRSLSIYLSIYLSLSLSPSLPSHLFVAQGKVSCAMMIWQRQWMKFVTKS